MVVKYPNNYLLLINVRGVNNMSSTISVHGSVYNMSSAGGVNNMSFTRGANNMSFTRGANGSVDNVSLVRGVNMEM